MHFVHNGSQWHGYNRNSYRRCGHSRPNNCSHSYNYTSQSVMMINAHSYQLISKLDSSCKCSKGGV